MKDIYHKCAIKSLSSVLFIEELREIMKELRKMNLIEAGGRSRLRLTVSRKFPEIKSSKKG